MNGKGTLYYPND